MPRILTECPTTRTPVSTGHRTFTCDLSTMAGDRSFRCGCGEVHVWRSETAWVEDAQSLDQEIAAEMRSMARLGCGDGPAETCPERDDVRGRQARQGRAARQALLRPW